MKKLIFIFSFSFLTACSNETHSIYGEIHSLEEDRIIFGCSDVVRKSNKSHSKEDIGYSCAIKITEETIIKTQAGDVLTFDELNKNNVVSVYFEEPITLSAHFEGLTLNAKEITVFENK